MWLYLVHHGDALPPDVDARRPLSPRGVAESTAVALEAVRRGVRPEAIWHSGKLRARQTAETFWRACNPLAEFSAIRGLQPADPASWMRDRLAGETRGIMCVGHFPHLSNLLRLLLTGSEDGSQSVPAHGLAALEYDASLRRWSASFSLTPEDVAPR